jgi:transcriptional regulator with XRE-family HTH domain
METKTWFQKKLDSFKADFEFRLETLIYKITEQISDRMDQKGISRTKFAQLMGISPPAVTKILNGNSNFTLKTLLSVADVLELDLKVNFEEKREFALKYLSQDPYPMALASETEPESATHLQVGSKAYSSSLNKDEQAMAA